MRKISNLERLIKLKFHTACLLLGYFGEKVYPTCVLQHVRIHLPDATKIRPRLM